MITHQEAAPAVAYSSLSPPLQALGFYEGAMAVHTFCHSMIITEKSLQSNIPLNLGCLVVWIGSYPVLKVCSNAINLARQLQRSTDWKLIPQS